MGFSEYLAKINRLKVKQKMRSNIEKWKDKLKEDIT